MPNRAEEVTRLHDIHISFAYSEVEEALIICSEIYICLFDFFLVSIIINIIGRRSERDFFTKMINCIALIYSIYVL